MIAQLKYLASCKIRTKYYNSKCYYYSFQDISLNFCTFASSGKGDAALLRCEMCSKVGVGMKFRSFRRFCSWTCIKKYKLANPSSLVKRTRKAKLKLKHKSEDMQSLHTHLSEVQLSQGVVIPSGVPIAQCSSTNLSCTTTPMDTSSEQVINRYNRIIENISLFFVQ